MKHVAKSLIVCLFAGCALSDSPDEDAALDSEHGLIDWGKADSNAVVYPGSPQADAVLAYVNQPINDPAAFETELDTKLHRRAAANIVAERVGPDGVIGTRDDDRFSGLVQLDRVPYVGPAAFAQLFLLAEAAGFFRPSTPCDPIVGNKITTLAQLVNLQSSGCDFFKGDVTIQLFDTLLPAQRRLAAFDNVRAIQGELKVLQSPALDEVVFRGLQEVGTFEDAAYTNRPALRMPALRRAGKLGANPNSVIDALVEAESLSVHRDHGGTFPALTKVGQLRVKGNVDGFDALEEAQTVTLFPRNRVTGFNDLVTAKRLAHRVRNEQLPGHGRWVREPRVTGIDVHRPPQSAGAAFHCREPVRVAPTDRGHATSQRRCFVSRARVGDEDRFAGRIRRLVRRAGGGR